MIIGYLGPRGTFSQKAAEIYLEKACLGNVALKEYGNIADLIIAVNEGDIEEAVVPAENSLEGSVNVTLDMLAWEVDLKIKKEIVLPITHDLLTNHYTED